MSSEIFKLKTLDVHSSVVRQTRTGVRNNPTTKSAFDQPDHMGDFIYSGETGIYTGERDVRTEYLIQGSVKANNIKTTVSYSQWSPDNKVVFPSGINPQKGDIVRNDSGSDTAFYTIKKVDPDGVTAYLDSYPGPFVSNVPTTLRKEILGNASFEYVRSKENQNAIFFDETKIQWGITGTQYIGPIPTQTGDYTFPADDVMNVLFQASATSTAPAITAVRSGTYTLVNKNTNAIADLPLNAIPYPHESLKVYWNISGQTLVQKTENIDYVINYSQNPDYTLPFPPQDQRQVGFIKFLESIDQKQLTIDETFTGNLSAIKTISVPGARDLKIPITNIVQDTEIIHAGPSLKNNNFDYVIDYKAGLVTFGKHVFAESIVNSVGYPQSLLWDGVSIIKGVSADKLTGETQVIPGITGLQGITGAIYFEDTVANNLQKDTDYTLEYDSASISITKPPASNEAMLVSYYVEGVDEQNENLTSSLRTSRFPLMAGTVTLTKIWTDSNNKDTTKVLNEGTDFKISYLTGKVTALAESLTDPRIKRLSISYTPMAQINCILQKDSNQNDKYRMTIVGDFLDIEDSLALKFKIDNPLVSTQVSDPFKASDDTSKVTYDGTIEVLMSVKILHANDSTDDLVLDGYKYDDENKELTLDQTKNALRPDSNKGDQILATYTFLSEKLPYAPVEAIFPYFEKGTNTFTIEGYDRTDVLAPEMILRIDNFDPEASYYFKLSDVEYDGDGTNVTVYGIFTDQIRNPTFYLFDSAPVFVALPDGTTINRSSTIGTNQLVFSGNLAQIKEALRLDCLLQINGSELYTVQSVTVSNGTIVTSIFPKLQDYITGDVFVTQDPITNEGTTDISALNPVLVSPTEPAFIINYNSPTQPVNLEGYGTIVIDNEKIVLYEYVGPLKNPVPYVYLFKNYSSLYQMAKAIQGTVSTFVPGTTYLPFTISHPENGTEDYFLGVGERNADLVIPFSQQNEQSFPYTVTVRPDLFKWSLTQVNKDAPYFLVERIDQTGGFLPGQLIAVQSKVNNARYYHMVTGSSVAPSVKNNGTVDTTVLIKDKFRINFIDPYMYKYDSPVWVNLHQQFTVSVATNEIIFFGNISSNIGPSYFLKFEDTYIFKVESVTYDGSNTVVKVSPSLMYGTTVLVKPEFYPGYVQITNIPIYIDGPTHQPFADIVYTAPKSHTGKGKVSITDKALILMEFLDGDTSPTKETTLLFTSYPDTYELLNAVNSVSSLVPGTNPFFTSVEVYKDRLKSGVYTNFSLVPIPVYSVPQDLPFRVYIMEKTFSIEYTVPSGYTGEAYIKKEFDNLTLQENLNNGSVGVGTGYVISYLNKTPSQIFSEIRNIVSTISGQKSFTVTEFSSPYDPESFFLTAVFPSFVIPVPYGTDFEKIPQSVGATVSTASWTLLGPLNVQRLVVDQDYSVEGASIVVKTAVVRRDRLLLNYFGLDNLSEFAEMDLELFCRFFSTLPVGYRVDVYMDFLNVDQFYVQKLTEQDFLQIVTVPQVEGLLVQKGGGGGVGADSSSNSKMPNYEGGLANLYYLLRDEQIKKAIYLKLYEWYKHRLRYFASETQLILGFKFAHSTHYYTDGNYYTLADSAVESQGDYELTKMSDILQINRGFSKFFPIGYDDAAPKYYDRFSTEYLNYTEVYCYNFRYFQNTGTVDNPVWKQGNTEGRVRSTKPYWAPKNGNSPSDLDHKILQSTSTIVVPGSGYVVPFDSDETTFDSNSTPFSFLKRINTGDKIKINERDNYYAVGTIVNRSGTYNSSDQGQSLAETLILDSTYFSEDNVKTYDLWQYDPAVQKYYYKVVISKGGYPPLIPPLFPNAPTVNPPDILVDTDPNNYVIWKYAPNYEAALGTKGFKIWIKRQSAEAFPTYNDEGNYGVSLFNDSIRGQKKNTNDIDKPLTLADIWAVLFPFLPSIEPNEFFNTSIGSYDDISNVFLPGTFNNSTNIFTEGSVPNSVINLKNLDFFQVRKVSDTINALTQDLNKVYSIDIPLDGKLDFFKPYNYDPSHGLHRFFNIDSERTYKYEDPDGYIDTLVFRTINRDTWFYFTDTSEEDVTSNYGVTTNQVYKGFYDPNNLYMKLLLEKQSWSTEELIIHDLYDIPRKLSRAYKDGVLNAGVLTDSNTGKPTAVLSYPKYHDFLITVGTSIQGRMNLYRNLLAFLFRPDLGDIGPVPGILQENDASDAIATSFAQTQEAYNRYTDFYNKSFGNPDSFYALNDASISNWSSIYAKWVLGLTEGTVYQLQAKQQLSTNVLLTFGYLPVDGLTIFFNTNANDVLLTKCYSAMVYDYTANSLAISLSCTYSYPNGGISGNFSNNFSFSQYKTVGELIQAINTYSYPGGSVFFSSGMNFQDYPYIEASLTTSRLVYYSSTQIPATGLIVQVTNVDDQRKYDARILYLTKGVYDRLVIEGEPAVEVWPSYIAYYNDPADPARASKINPKKAALQGLKVPGSWLDLTQQQLNVISITPYDQSNYALYVTFSQLFDTSMALSDYLYDNIIVPESAFSLLSSIQALVKTIDTYVPTASSTTPVVTGIYSNTLDAINSNSHDFGLQPEAPLLKSIAFTINGFGTSKTFVLNARKYKTIGDVIDVLNRYFYLDTSTGHWVPEEGTSVNLSDPKYVRLFSASIAGDNEALKRTFSTFDLNLNYVRLVRDFILSEEGIEFPKPGQALGWVPDNLFVGARSTLTIGTRPNEYYSQYYLYNFDPLPGMPAVTSSLSINSNHPNKYILPFDVYCLDTGGTYRVAANVLYVQSDSVPFYAIPLTGAPGHPELNGDTLGDLVDRINKDANINTYFYANLKFARAKGTTPQYGYFEYTYLPDQSGVIPQALKETLYLAPDSNVLTLSVDNADGAKYNMVEGSTPGTTAEINILANVRAMTIIPNTNDYVLSNSLYKIDPIGQIALSCNYARSYSYTTTLNFSSYPTIGALNSAINSVVDPVYGQFLYSSSPFFPTSASNTLAQTSTLNLTAYLRRKNSSTVLLRVLKSSFIHAGISYSSATCMVSGSSLTLTANVVYSGVFSNTFALSDTVTNISAAIAASNPGMPSIFPSLYYSSVTATAYAGYLGTAFTPTGTSLISLGAGVYAYIQATRSYFASSTLRTLVDSINSETNITGVSASYAFTADPGYKDIDALYLIPSPLVLTDFTKVTIGADYSTIPAMYLMKMETAGSYSVSNGVFNVTSAFPGSFNIPLPADKNLRGWIAGIIGDFTTGLRSIDILPIGIPTIAYGSLNIVAATQMVGNPPTHVFFGVLGDIKFYQISDIDLYNQLSIIKRRLAEPWRGADGKTILNPDYYNDLDFYESFGNPTVPYDSGNVQAIYKDKFLNYLRSTRFSQLKESIGDEQIINNKYLWLYLKFHKEMGCDQKVNMYLRKIKTDESDTGILPQE